MELHHRLLRRTDADDDDDEQSLHTSLITRTPSEETAYNVLIVSCFVYCAVVLICYSDVLNKVSSYTALVE